MYDSGASGCRGRCEDTQRRLTPQLTEECYASKLDLVVYWNLPFDAHIVSLLAARGKRNREHSRVIVDSGVRVVEVMNRDTNDSEESDRRLSMEGTLRCDRARLVPCSQAVLRATGVGACYAGRLL